jgi:hypothetical protein
MTDKDVERVLPTLEQVHAFLLGTAPIDGLWFGDADSGRPYWWRKFLRAAIAAYESAVGEELAVAKSVIAEANNSLYGSQGYFISAVGGGVFGAVGVTGEPDKYHLATPIEKLKANSRAAWRALRYLEQGLSNDALDTLRAALTSTDAVTEIAKLGTVSLTSFDGHCVRIDFPNREDAERMYAALTEGSR